MSPEPAGDPTPALAAAPSVSAPSASALASPPEQQQQQPPGPVGWTGLPSDALAHSFAFLPFSDLRSAVLTGKHAALDAAKKLDTLNITEVSELNLRAVQRYRENVKVVSIGCLFNGRINKDVDWRIRQFVSEKACSQIAPFLGGFPKLRKAILYGIVSRSGGTTPRRKERREIYLHNADEDDIVSTPENRADNDARMKILLHSFCGAFRAGALPSDLAIVGLVEDDSCYFAPPS